MRIRNFIPTLLVALAVFTCAPFALAQSANDAPAQVTRDQAVSIARDAVKGRILSVQLSVNVWQVKVLTDDGSVHVVHIDANSGRVLATN